MELEDRVRVDGAIQGLQVATQRGRRLVAELERLAVALEGARPEQIPAIEIAVREQIEQIAHVRARTTLALAECAEVTTALAATIAVLRVHVEWLEAAR